MFSTKQIFIDNTRKLVSIGHQSLTFLPLLMHHYFNVLPPIFSPFLLQLQLGDLISFKRSGYKHWAVYVGKGRKDVFKNKKDDQDIFHLNGML